MQAAMKAEEAQAPTSDQQGPHVEPLAEPPTEGEVAAMAESAGVADAVAGEQDIPPDQQPAGLDEQHTEAEAEPAEQAEAALERDEHAEEEAAEAETSEAQAPAAEDEEAAAVHAPEVEALKAELSSHSEPAKVEPAKRTAESFAQPPPLVSSSAPSTPMASRRMPMSSASLALVLKSKE